MENNTTMKMCHRMLCACTSTKKYVAFLQDMFYCHSTFISTCYYLAQTGATPLFIASQKGHSEVVKILIKNGADVDLARKVCRYNVLSHYNCSYQ